MTWQKKVVGRSEEGLFEALELSDKVLDEELEVVAGRGTWTRGRSCRR